MKISLVFCFLVLAGNTHGCIKFTEVEPCICPPFPELNIEPVTREKIFSENTDFNSTDYSVTQSPVYSYISPDCSSYKFKCNFGNNGGVLVDSFGGNYYLGTQDDDMVLDVASIYKCDPTNKKWISPNFPPTEGFACMPRIA